MNINNNEEMFFEIAKKQMELNNLTAGNNWFITGINEKTGKIINWNRASWLEMAEFVDSFDWKHWKKGNNNIENAKVELIDILHFLVSQMIVENYESTKLIEDNEEIVKTVYNNISKKLSIIFSLQNNEEEDIFKLADLFVANLLNNNKINDITLLMFSKLCFLLGLTPEELYKGYMVKNILNKFRQDNGYNSGEYIKEWTFEGKKVEDNVATYETASKLLSEGKKVSEELYIELEKIYKTFS